MMLKVDEAINGSSTSASYGNVLFSYQNQMLYRIAGYTYRSFESDLKQITQALGFI